MPPNNPGNSGTRYHELIARLSQVPQVKQFDDNDHSEAETLAHAFLDLERSCQKFVNEHLPRVFDPHLTNEDLVDALFDIGEEFRHILYHVRDPRFYRYLEPGP
jgi:hypothetical protein